MDKMTLYKDIIFSHNRIFYRQPLIINPTS